MPVKKKTVDSWGIECLKYEVGEDGQTVVKMHCGVCRDYYTNRRNMATTSVRGAVLTLADKWITGTENIKKSNAFDHISKSALHKTASYALRKKENTQSHSESDSSASCASNILPRQATLPELTAKITAAQKEQLIMKFQLVHFLTTKCKPLEDYVSIANFEKNVHHVNIGSGYLTNNAANSMVKFLAKHIRQEEIIKIQHWQS